MKTIEKKFLDIDPKEIEKKLIKIGAKKTLDGTIEAVYFDYADRRLESSNTILRLRKKGTQYMLTVKKELERDKAKTTEKYFTRVYDFESTRKILKAAGFSELRGVKRKRKRYNLNGKFFDIDFIKGVPPFIEIECENNKEIEEFKKKLGIQTKGKPWTVKEVLKHYKKD